MYVAEKLKENTLKKINFILIACAIFLSGCVYEPPSETFTLFISKVWNVFFSIGYISILIGIFYKSAVRGAFLGFGIFFLIATYMSLLCFISFTGASIELVKPYYWLK